MAYTSFRAGSGDYQYVRPLLINPSAVPGLTTNFETFSVAQANIASGGGAITDFTTDSLLEAQFASPKGANINGLIIEEAFISATGEITLVISNPTMSTITPPAGTQVNLLVL